MIITGADSHSAACMMQSLMSCVNFLHETVPARQSALSHALDLYLNGYCHPTMKCHVYQVCELLSGKLPVCEMLFGESKGCSVKVLVCEMLFGGRHDCSGESVPVV